LKLLVHQLKLNKLDTYFRTDILDFIFLFKGVGLSVVQPHFVRLGHGVIDGGIANA
jgi:hypothetical protein